MILVKILHRVLEELSVNSRLIVIDSCNFEDNEALTSGGALYTLGGTTSISNSEFNENTGRFGGVHYNDGSNVIASNNIYDSNSGDQGGTIYNNRNGGTINATNCTFEGNSAMWGGAIGDAGSVSNYTDCLFAGNQADNGGGAGLVGQGVGESLLADNVLNRRISETPIGVQ